MKNVMVTGGAGFIGSHVCESLINRGFGVVCVDNFNDYYNPKMKEENIKNISEKNNFKLYKADVTDFEEIKKIFEKNKIDIILHFAARAGVRPSIENPALYVKTNVEGTLNLLELAKKFGSEKFIFASSSSVYGLGRSPFREDVSSTNSISPYAATKLSGETFCRTYHELYGLNVVCLRFFTVYGPRGRPDMAPYLFMKKIFDGEELNVFGDGNSRRDYTFVGDIVEGIIKSLEKPLKFEIINLGNSNPVDLNSFIKILEKNTGKKALKKFCENQKGDVPLTCAEITKAKNLLGWNPNTGLDEGIKKMVDWYMGCAGP